MKRPLLEVELDTTQHRSDGRRHRANPKVRDLALDAVGVLLGRVVPPVRAIAGLEVPRPGCRALLHEAVRQVDQLTRSEWIPIHAARCFDRRSRQGSGGGDLLCPPSSVGAARVHSSNALGHQASEPAPISLDQQWWRGSGRVGPDVTNSPGIALAICSARAHHRVKPNGPPTC